MKEEEKKCPNCGHDVLSWDVICPGCSQVPWDTNAGRRIVRWRRLRMSLVYSVPLIVILCALLLYVLLRLGALGFDSLVMLLQITLYSAFFLFVLVAYPLWVLFDWLPLHKSGPN